MSVSFKVENISISAVRDRAMFNTFAGNQSYVIKGIGDELAVTSSANSFVVTLGTGEAVICGGSMLSEGDANTLTLGQNENGYIVIEVDLSQTGTNICRFASVASLVQQNINDGSEYVYDLPLYQYTTSSEGVQNMVDIREIRNAPIIATENIENASGISLTKQISDINSAISDLSNNKQNKLTAGSNIAINSNVISAVNLVQDTNGEAFDISLRWGIVGSGKNLPYYQLRRIGNAGSYGLGLLKYLENGTSVNNVLMDSKGNRNWVYPEALNFTSGTLLDIIKNNPQYTDFIKTGSTSISDFPLGELTTEATINIVKQSDTRIEVILTTFTNPQRVYARRIFNGAWNDTNWNYIGGAPVELWKNPNNATEDFGAQTITIANMTQHKKILIVYKMGSNLANDITLDVPLTLGTAQYRPLMINSYNGIFYRITTVNPTNNTIQFSTGVVVNTANAGSSGNDNSKMIPLAVYGV